MYKIKIQADDELKKFVVSGKDAEDKFISITATVIIDDLYRNGCPESLIQMMASPNPETRKRVISAMRECFLKRVKEGIES